MSIEQASVMIGKFFPEIKDKLLNTIQLSDLLDKSSESDLLVATIEQRSAQLSPIHFSDAVNLRGNLKWLGLFFGTLLLLVLLMVFLPSFAVQPTQRIVNYEQVFEKPLHIHWGYCVASSMNRGTFPLGHTVPSSPTRNRPWRGRSSI